MAGFVPTQAVGLGFLVPPLIAACGWRGAAGADGLIVRRPCGGETGAALLSEASICTVCTAHVTESRPTPSPCAYERSFSPLKSIGRTSR